MLSLYRALLKLRREEPALAIGDLQLLDGSEHVLAYERRHGSTRLQVLLNLSGTERRIPVDVASGAPLLSTLGTTRSDGWLRPDEGLILKLEG